MRKKQAGAAQRVFRSKVGRCPRARVRLPPTIASLCATHYLTLLHLFLSFSCSPIDMETKRAKPLVCLTHYYFFALFLSALSRSSRAPQTGKLSRKTSLNLLCTLIERGPVYRNDIKQDVYRYQNLLHNA